MIQQISTHAYLRLSANISCSKLDGIRLEALSLISERHITCCRQHTSQNSQNYWNLFTQDKDPWKDFQKVDNILLNRQLPTLTFPGTTTTYTKKIDDELNTGKSNVSRLYSRLEQEVWFNKDLIVETECTVIQGLL